MKLGFWDTGERRATFRVIESRPNVNPESGYLETCECEQCIRAKRNELIDFLKDPRGAYECAAKFTGFGVFHVYR